MRQEPSSDKFVQMLEDTSLIRIQNRLKEIKITRLRFGKALLNDHLHKLKIHPDGLCHTCKMPETTEHCLLNCEESKMHEAIKTKCREMKLNPEIPSILQAEEILNQIYENIKRKL